MCRFLLTFLLFGACGSEVGIDPRFVAVHNTMTAMGLAPTVPISSGSLTKDTQVELPLSMKAGACYTLLALASPQEANIDVRVVDPLGDELVRDLTSDAQAVVQVCPTTPGPHRVILALLGKSGTYTLSVWSGAVSQAELGKKLPRRPVRSQGSCSNPFELRIGQTLRGDTRQGNAVLRGSCVRGHAAEQVYRIDIDRTTQVSITADTTFDGTLYLFSECGSRGAELACNDDNPNTTRSRVEATLQPGTYYVVVDGYGDAQGEYSVRVEGSPLQDVAAVCADARPMRIGRPVSGTTQGSADYFQASCARSTTSSDRVFRLQLPRRMRLRVRQQTDHDGALYMRTSCDDAETEVACNDDFRNQRSALIRGIFDAGTYYVYTDGFAPSQVGRFTMRADSAPVSGGGSKANTCSAAEPLKNTMRIDSLSASHTTQGSCGGLGPDVVYTVDVARTSQLAVSIREPEFTGSMYLRPACEDATRELGCVAFAAGKDGVLRANVSAGRYFLFVDGASATDFGSATLEMQVEDRLEAGKACRAAPFVREGKTTNSTTTGRPDLFHAPCAGGTRSGDRVYKLRVPQRSLVRVRVAMTFDGALHVRSDCLDPESTLVCNDDYGDSRHSGFAQILEKGTYYLIVDGFRAENQGDFSLDVEILAPDLLPDQPILPPTTKTKLRLPLGPRPSL